MPNRLALEKSPYLLQHAANPVDWYPWGPEALNRARKEDKPLLVSIGYSACHWCHVMEHESFEDEDTAQLMNERFVSVKVDREERPDVDAIYMEAVQALTGQGGWPLNVFVTPDGHPFYGGTYFPPEPRHGMPSWKTVLRSVSDAYLHRREEILRNARSLTQFIEEAQARTGTGRPLSQEVLADAYRNASTQFDWTEGGFGGAPKFPQPLGLELVLRLSHRFGDESGLAFVRLTLDRMAAGGIHDHLGGGFHRYTVDGRWVVPHFEKMLYDNALLARVYLQAYQATGETRYRTVAESTLDYLLADMRAPEGAFYSAEDADSEGIEGKFYVWTPQQFRDVLGDDAEIASLRFGVRPEGNFEGKTILTVDMSLDAIAERTGRTLAEVEESLRRAREWLRSARDERVQPGKDTKILASWNGLVIRSLAEAAPVFGRPDYLAAAERAAAFVLREMRPGGRLVRSYRGGPGEIPGFLEDYAFLAEALLSLYEGSFDSSYFNAALDLVQEMVERFRDVARGAFFDTPAGSSDLVVRPRGFFDNPIPSGNSSASFALLRLAALTEDERFTSLAVAALEAVSDLASRAPLALSYMLSALDFYQSSPLQIAIVGGPDPDTRALTEQVFRRYLPSRVLAVGEGDGVPLLAGRDRIDGRPTAYVCKHFSCRLPVTDPERLDEQLANPDP